jgi:hypothetical protein
VFLIANKASPPPPPPPRTLHRLRLKGEGGSSGPQATSRAVMTQGKRRGSLLRGASLRAGLLGSPGAVPSLFSVSFLGIVPPLSEEKRACAPAERLLREDHDSRPWGLMRLVPRKTRAALGHHAKAPVLYLKGCQANFGRVRILKSRCPPFCPSSPRTTSPSPLPLDPAPTPSCGRSPPMSNA